MLRSVLVETSYQFRRVFVCLQLALFITTPVLQQRFCRGVADSSSELQVLT